MFLELNCTPNTSIINSVEKSIVFLAKFQAISLLEWSWLSPQLSSNCYKNSIYNWQKTCAAIALIIWLDIESEANSNYSEQNRMAQNGTE